MRFSTGRLMMDEHAAKTTHWGMQFEDRAVEHEFRQDEIRRGRNGWTASLIVGALVFAAP